ncbi:Internalin-J precursor [compost metagenome]
MKKIVLSLLLFSTAIVTAQDIVVPDGNFFERLLAADTTNETAKNSTGVSIKIDANDDNIITQAEVSEVYELRVPSGSIISLSGIEYFTNLTYLNCFENQITTLDISALVNLEELYCAYNQINSINFGLDSSLKKLNCDQNSLVNLDVTGLVDLVELRCASNDLEFLFIGGLTNVELLDCNSNHIAVLDLEGFSKLKNLNCYWNALTSLDFNGLDDLEDLNCNANNVSVLDVSMLIKLKNLNCSNNALTTLDLNANINLESLSCFSNQLVTLFLKNGKNETFDPANWGENPVLEYICADESQIAELMVDMPETVQVNSYCSYGPGGIYNRIEGTVTLDMDNDGCDVDDIVMPSLKLKISDGAYEDFVFTKTDGAYTFYTGIADYEYTITPVFENDYFIVEDAIQSFPLLDGSVAVQNFCVMPNGVRNDVEVAIAPTTNARPGFDAVYKIVYKNKGNQVISGSVACDWDSTRLELVSMDPEANIIQPNTYTWNYTNLQPFESREILVTMNVNAPTDTPAVNIDDILPFVVRIYPDDEVMTDNYFAFNQVVEGSMDPNDIVCMEGDNMPLGTAGNYLHYVVNFENVGPSPATFIVVKQIINPDDYDINTLQIINTSNDVTARIQGNTIEFRFEDINLAMGHHGHILYKLRPRAGIVANEKVTNSANIYFDYNFPIETNEASTIFGVLGTGEFTIDSSIKIYPNPVKDKLNIVADTTLKSIHLYDMQGRLLQVALENDTKADFDITERAAGIYFMKITTDKGIKVEKLIKE